MLETTSSSWGGSSSPADSFHSPGADSAAGESHSQTPGMPKLVLDYGSLKYLLKTLISLSVTVVSFVPNKLLGAHFNTGQAENGNNFHSNKAQVAQLEMLLLQKKSRHNHETEPLCVAGLGAAEGITCKGGILFVFALVSSV